MSQNNIDQIILNNITTPGFFIEAGGSHPEDQNNTKLLESNRWKGLIIEPKTDWNDLYKNIRPNSILENYVLVSEDHKEKTISGDFSQYMMGGVTNYHNFPDWNPIEYPCITLDKLLKKHNITEVTFFSLDVEGYEVEVLKGINFNDVFFHIIFVENHWNKDDFSFLEKFNFVKKYSLPIYNHEVYINTQSPYFKTFTI